MGESNENHFKDPNHTPKSKSKKKKLSKPQAKSLLEKCQSILNELQASDQERIELQSIDRSKLNSDKEKLKVVKIYLRRSKKNRILMEKYHEISKEVRAAEHSDRQLCQGVMAQTLDLLDKLKDEVGDTTWMDLMLTLAGSTDMEVSEAMNKMLSDFHTEEEERSNL